MGRRLLAALTVLVAIAAPVSAQPQEQKPNFVIMVIDDAALMDLGIYGGEAATPNIDALASSGAMFTQYRSSPLCRRNMSANLATPCVWNPASPRWPHA